MTLTVGLVLVGGLLAFAGRAWVQIHAPGVIPPWVTVLEAVREVVIPLLLVVPATHVGGAWAWLAGGIVVGVAGIRLARDARHQAVRAARDARLRPEPPPYTDETLSAYVAELQRQRDALLDDEMPTAVRQALR